MYEWRKMNEAERQRELVFRADSCAHCIAHHIWR